MRQIIVYDSNDYREGPVLHITNEDDTEIEYPCDYNIYYKLNIDTLDDQISVYYVCLSCYEDDYQLVKLDNFDDPKKAFEYAKQQFTLYNKFPPFVQTDMNSAGHPTGSRPKIEIPKDMVCKIPNRSYMPFDYRHEFIILADNDFEVAYSLNCISKWPLNCSISYNT